MSDKHTMWYLATPYRYYPAGLAAAFIMACRLANRIIRLGVPVYSPIAHYYSIADHGGGLDRIDPALWERFYRPMVNACTGIVVAKMESWEISIGMAHEIQEFLKAGKPVVYWDPATDVPETIVQGVVAVR